MRSILYGSGDPTEMDVFNNGDGYVTLFISDDIEKKNVSIKLDYQDCLSLACDLIKLSQELIKTHVECQAE